MTRLFYPVKLKKNRIEGVVYVDVVVDKRGRVAKIAKVTGEKSLFIYAIRAARRAKFKPARYFIEPHKTVNSPAQIRYFFGH